MQVIEMYLQHPQLGPTSNAVKRDFYSYLTSATIMTYQLVSIPTAHRLSVYLGTVGVPDPSHGNTAAVVDDY